MNSLIQDVRYAARMLARSPGFTTVAVLTLALGIGLTTAMFSVLNSVIFRPLSYRQTDRIVAMYENRSDPLMLQDIDGWREKLGSLDKITWFHQTESNLTGGENPRSVRVGRIPASFFDLFGLAPQAGRLLDAGDENLGGPLVAVVSESFQRSQFPRYENIIGETVQVNGVTYTIVGVADAGALFRTVRVWLPEMAQGALNRKFGEPFRYYGRLRPGFGVAQARAELETIFPPSTGRSGRSRSRVRVYGLEEDVVGGRTRRGVYLFFGAASLVWLLVCVNLANLILSRMFDRQKELAVRSALGARRSRIIRQVLTETTLLSLLGGAVGLFLAYGGLAYLLALIGNGIPEAIEVGMDGTVLLFALTISLITGWVFGVVPVLNVRNLSVVEVLKAGMPGGDSRRRILRNLLVALQVTLALTLLSGTGLLIRSYFARTAVDLGVRTNDVIWIEPSLPPGVYPLGEVRRQYLEAVSRELELLPGVNSAGLGMYLPLGGGEVHVLVHADELPGQDLNFMVSFVDPGVLRAVGARLLAGRFLTRRDKDDRSAVALLSAAAAAEFGGPEKALGKWVGRPGGDRFQVVGVIAGIRPRGPRSEAKGQLFAPQWFRDSQLDRVLSATPPVWIVQVTEKAPASFTDLRRGIWAIDPNVPVKIQSMADRVDGSYYASNRRYATLFSLMGGTSLLIASLGLYGVLAFTVRQRTHEIGVRMALGAQRGNVLRMVLRQGMVLTAIGIAGGLVASYWLTKYLKSFLFEVEPTDPLTFTAVALLLAVVALAACWIPARRATRVDPMTALRNE